MAKRQANFRIDADMQDRAYAVLEKLGIRPSDAISMFLNHVAMHQELPFQPNVPKTEIIEGFQKVDQGIGLTKHKNIDDMFTDLGL